MIIGKITLIIFIISFLSFSETNILKKGMDTRTPEEMLRDFHAQAKQHRVCAKKKECVLRRVGCGDVGVNRKHLKEFYKLILNVHILCGATTKCQSVDCVNKECVSKDCHTSSI
jgi:hypothetical protein